VTSRNDALAIQDYLDGRMDPAARASFEARIASEPDLARRLAALREIGQALRTEEPLPPGFHERLRERVARTDAGTRARLAPWWGTGLAAAATLALLVGVPYWLRSSSAPEAVVAHRAEPQRAQAPEDADAVRAAPEPDARFAPPEPEDASAAPPDAPEASDLSRSDERSARAESPVGPPLAEPAPSLRQAQPPSPAAPAPSPAPHARPKDSQRRESDRVTMAEVETKAGAGSIRLASWPGIALPRALVPAGASETIEGADGWAVFLRASGIEGPPGLEAIGDHERVVLVSAGDGALDCAASLVVETEAAWTLRPERAEPAAGAPGCAWRLPRDGRRVEVDRP